MSRKPIIVIAVPASDGMEGATGIALATLCAYSAKDFDLRPIYTENPNIAITRNMAVAVAKMHRADYLFFIDSDMKFPRDALIRLFAHQKEIVGAIYPRRKPPHIMLGVALNAEEGAKQDGLSKMHNIPTGILLIKMPVFKKIDRPYFRCPFNEYEITGEDVDFCERARDSGLTIYNDVGLSKEIRHIGTTDYGYDSEEVQEAMEDHRLQQEKAMTTPISISVLIPTRGRPDMLKMAVMALDHLSSDLNKITYCIATDKDDVPGNLAAQSLAMNGNVNIIMDDRPSGIGKLYNDLAKANPADAYVLFADDVVPMVQDWDVLVAKGMEQFPVLAWYDSMQPSMATYPIISRAWYEAMGRIYPEDYPFWFNDTHLNELVTMVTGRKIPIAKDIPLGGKRGRTMRLRDLGFWCDYFRDMRIKRLDEATAIAAKLNIPAPPLGKMSVAFENNDLFLARNIERFEAMFGEDMPPTPEYTVAMDKAKAEIAAMDAAETVAD